jgi:two-component system OmpR family sensor kinase
MRRLSRLSIRWRLTIGSVLVAAVLLTGAALVFRQQIQQAQINSDKKLLYGASTPYITQITNHPGQIDKPAGEQRVVVVNPVGRGVASNLPDSLSARLDQLSRLGSGSHFVTLGGTEYLVVVRVVHAPQGDWKVIATRDQGTTTAIVLSNLTNILLIGGLILLVGIGIASWVLATVALRPVTLMRRRAESLPEFTSTELLPVSPARDELSALATTLNAFLTRIRAGAARERQMVSDASHELRTPIAVLRAQLELAHLSTGDVDALRKDLEAAEETAERLSRLATNLLTLSAIETERTPEHANWSDLVEEFLAASDRAQLLGLSKSLNIDFSVADPEGTEGYAISPTSFGQVLDNLVGNAIHAVPQFAAVRARLVRAERGLELSVTDSGPGVPDEFIGVAFDRFTRRNEERAITSGGAGLGLAIVRAIVLRSGGEVSMANVEPSGLEVTVRVPFGGR